MDFLVKVRLDGHVDPIAAFRRAGSGPSLWFVSMAAMRTSLPPAVSAKKPFEVAAKSTLRTGSVRAPVQQMARPASKQGLVYQTVEKQAWRLAAGHS
jgi:hypothetical protein